MNPLRIAFLPIVRVQFDVALAQTLITAARQDLCSAGFELVAPEQAISSLEQAQAAVRMLQDHPVDLVLIFQATFADAGMAVEIAGAASAPVFLWAVPEAWTGERLRLNSLCGINLAGHALTLRGLPYDYGYALPGDPGIREKVASLARAGSLRKRLKSARLGVVGEPPAGMDTCRLDEACLKEWFGLEIHHINLEDVFARARSISTSKVAQTRATLDARLDHLGTLDQGPLAGTLSVYHALNDIASEGRLDGLAVRCWPEFFTTLGCAACGAMSLLSDGFGMDAPLPCSCEADINGTVTQLMLQSLSDAPAFGTDIVGVDPVQDRVALWHCGLAPLTMSDPNSPVKGGIHSNRKLPLVMDFTLKPGPVTFARLSQASGNLRLVIGSGEMLPLPRPFQGTSGTLKPDLPASEFLERFMTEGLEHHISLVYGHYTHGLSAFARLLGMPVLRMENHSQRRPE